MIPSHGETSKGMGSGARTSFVAAAGYRLHFRQIERERTVTPTLVFLHEGLGTIDLWVYGATSRMLSATRRVAQV